MLVLVVGFNLCALYAAEATVLTTIGFGVPVSPHVSAQCGVVREGRITHSTPVDTVIFC